MEILDLTTKQRFLNNYVFYESDHFALAYKTTEHLPFLIVLGDHSLEIEPNTTLISCKSLELLHNRSEELFYHLLFDRDISLWTEEFIFYMVLKFQLVRNGG